MQINLNTNNYYNTQPTFKSLRVKVFKPAGNGFHIPEFSHNRDTAVYRKDMDWKKLVSFITNK